MMKTLRLTLRPASAFGTPLVGDTLFGHLCWMLREGFGNARLKELLDGYTSGRPFAVLSDAFVSGFVPKPHLPDFVTGRESDPAQRKELRQKIWLPASEAHLPLSQWLHAAVAQDRSSRAKSEVLVQNTINRLTGTTGTAMFAPRQVERTGFPAAARLDIYAVLDEQRMDSDTLIEAMRNIGHHGYGRDATTGLGKFEMLDSGEQSWPNSRSNVVMTLAPCAPDPERLDAARCFFEPLTRFGRHGNIAVLRGQPFKLPLLMMCSAAVLTLRESPGQDFHGTGLGGLERPLSRTIPETVHQGYAPVLPLNAELTV